MRPSELDALTEEADEATRQDLAERYAVEVGRDLAAHPVLSEAAEGIRAGGDPRTQPVLLHAVAELLNPAQIDVLQRMHAIVYPDGQP